MDYDKISNIESCYISEVFRSIQGEGILVGCPTTFIRFATCSMRCAFCDTKSAWVKKPEQKTTCKDLYKNVSIMAPTDEWICFTGGEPLEQLDSLTWLVEKFYRNGYRKISIETSGWPVPERLNIYDMQNDQVLFSVSPKLPYALKQRFSLDRLVEVLKFWNDIIYVPFKKQFKFVVSDQFDLDVLSEALKKQPVEGHLFIQPEHKQMGKAETLAGITDFVMKHKGFRISVQAHKVLKMH